MRIRNFQKLRKFNLVLDRSLTVLSGKTGSGKSSALRALRWICFNKIRGDSFRSWETAKTEGEVKVDDGKVLRARGDSSNYYKVNDKKLKAFKGSVPDDISRLLNLGPENFAGQHDASFLLSLTPGQAALALNKIVNLGLIDKTLAILGSDLRKAKATVEVSEGRLKAAKERRDSLAWVEQADQDLKRLEDLEQRGTALCEKIVQVEELLEVRQKVLEHRQNASEGLQWVQERLSPIDTKLVRLRRKIERVESILDEMKEKEKERCHLLERLQETQIKLKKLLSGKCPVCRRPMPT